MDYNVNISNIETKYLRFSAYNKFTDKMCERKTKEKGLVDESNISNFIKNSDLNTKFSTLATKAELKAE